MNKLVLGIGITLVSFLAANVVVYAAPAKTPARTAKKLQRAVESPAVNIVGPSARTRDVNNKIDKTPNVDLDASQVNRRIYQNKTN